MHEVVQFKIQPELKREMERVCYEMGMTAATAYRIFARKMIKDKKFPFEITADGIDFDNDISDDEISNFNLIEKALLSITDEKYKRTHNE